MAMMGLRDYPPGYAGKTTWIAERFHVEKDHFGAWIFFPILKEIVYGHVGFISHADEGGDAEMEASSGSQNS